MDQHAIWSEDQNTILRIFSNEFCRRFKRDLNVDPSQAVPLSRDIPVIDNEKLICEPTDDKILQVVIRLVLLKV